MVCWPRPPQYCLLAAQGRFRTGGSLAATTPDSCCDGRSAGRNRAFRFRALSHLRPGARPVRRLRGVRTSRSWPRRSRRGRARPCASSSPRKSRSTASCRWSRPTEASPPSRASGSAGRPISGSPKSTRLPPGNGGRTLPRRTAAMLPAKLPCAPISRRGRKLRQEASGRCAMPGIAAWRTCSRPGSRSCSTRRSTPHRHGRRCMKCCATSRAMSCSTTSASAKTR